MNSASFFKEAPSPATFRAAQKGSLVLEEVRAILHPFASGRLSSSFLILVASCYQ